MKTANTHINKLLLALTIAGSLTACEPATQQHTKETQTLLQTITDIHTRGIMFGHHDDTLYGIRWEGDPGRSDVKSVCGDYPAVISFDLGHIELQKNTNLDNISFTQIKNEIINHHNRGGICTLSWHANNPITGGDSWDTTDTTVVAAILPGGTHHTQFLQWLDHVATFINNLTTPTGTKIPILFRPWHEHTGSWFWWGQNQCTTQQYKTLWQLTYDRMRYNNVNNILYAYSPGSEPNNITEYLERYPGNHIIHLLGLDTYQFDRQEYIQTLEKSLTILTQAGQTLRKPIALTETGYEAIPDPHWWTQTLLPVITKYPLAYILVWRNAREMENHYYAPYPGQTSAGDFVKFYENPRILFNNDIKK